MEDKVINFPRLMLPFDKKDKEWRKQCIQFADQKTFLHNSVIRSSVNHKIINYNLLNGILNMNDLQLIINPDSIEAKYIPTKILHYPIINTKLELLQGEESKRLFDYKVVITNPNAISEIEENKKEEIFQRLQEEVQNTALSEEDFQAKIQKIQQYYSYEYLDIREVWANSLLNHYSKEYNMPLMFNLGFKDVETVAEELYLVDIISGEPTVEKLNPLKVRILSSGYSNRAEDADMIILEDYWSPARIIDTYYESLTEKDIKQIEELPNTLDYTEGNPLFSNPRNGFKFVGEEGTQVSTDEINRIFTTADEYSYFAPYDFNGNIKVLRVFWKSKRRIKKIKSYNIETGEVEYTLKPETYKIDENKGEEETIMWINEAWEGTLIGKDIFVNIRPRPIQYNRMSNPSRCHFGIIGQVYNTNDNKPFSLVDRVKPYAYLYDVIHDRMNKLIAHNYGKLVQLDMAKKPQGWDVDKWLYFARVENLAVVDSFNAANEGPATGKLAGGLNNASSGAIDADQGNAIQQYMNLLQYIKLEVGEILGISKQREGLISNRETVGGVERSTLQSSHITEWLFLLHQDVMKRVYEALLEAGKIAYKGKKKKLQLILPDFAQKAIEIDGDIFAECDYGLLVDVSQGSQELNQKLDMLAQAALQNGTLNFSTIMKLYLSVSISEKVRMVADNEAQLKEQQQLQLQQLLQALQLQVQAQLQQKQQELDAQIAMNSEDNETKVMIAQIQADAKTADNTNELNLETNKEKLLQDMKQFDAKIRLEREKLNHQIENDNKTLELNRQKLLKQSTKTSK